MLEKSSQITGRNAQLAMLLRHRWQAEIEKAVDKIKMGVVPARKRTKTDKWFRAMMRDRRRKVSFSGSREIDHRMERHVGDKRGIRSV
ncbi:MAG: hypothetical protein ABIF19_06230 [Planctomycetota bacterium]